MVSYETEIVANEKIAEGISVIALAVNPEVRDKFKPGMFAQVSIPGAGQMLLKRPISINSLHHGRMMLIFQIAGEGTALLSQAIKGTNISVIAPLGNGFRLPGGTKKVWLLGGGMGVSPMLSVVEEYKGIEFTAFLGFKSERHIYSADSIGRYCKETVICTDDGSAGILGTNVAAMEQRLKNDRPDMILSCGPKPMLKALKNVCGAYGIPCQASIEERMGCGFGVCRACACKVKTGGTWDYKRVCFDGPVFDISGVVFDG